MAPEVLKAMLPVLTEHHGNPASKSHSFGWHAEALVDVAREQVASLINASPEEIIFTSGATEANNIALKGSDVCKHFLTAKTEHKSVLDPIIFLKSKGSDVSFFNLDSEGHIKSDPSMSKPPEIISLMLANNEIGTIHDISSIFAKHDNCLKHCDATQGLGKIDIDVRELGADLISMSAHKIYGPKGIGALYVKKASLPKSFTSLFHGGGHENNLRSGTLNVAGIVGFGKACKLAKQRLEQDTIQIEALTKKMLSIIKNEIPETLINGSTSNRLLGNLNLSIPKLKSSELISDLSTSIALSSSSACQSSIAKPSHVLEALGFEKQRQQEAFRIGIGRYNTELEIETAASKITQKAKRFKHL